MRLKSLALRVKTLLGFKRKKATIAKKESVIESTVGESANPPESNNAAAPKETQK